MRHGLYAVMLPNRHHLRNLWKCVLPNLYVPLFAPQPHAEPTAQDCSETVHNAESCADPSWVLFSFAFPWDGVCCLPGWNGVLSSTSVGQGVCLPPNDNSPDLCKTSTVVPSTPAGFPASTVTESSSILQTGFLQTTPTELSHESTTLAELPGGSATHTQLLQESTAITVTLQASSTGTTTSNPHSAARLSPGGIADISFGAIAVAIIALCAYCGMRNRKQKYL